MQLLESVTISESPKKVVNNEKEKYSNTDTSCKRKQKSEVPSSSKRSKPDKNSIPQSPEDFKKVEVYYHKPSGTTRAASELNYQDLWILRFIIIYIYVKGKGVNTKYYFIV